MIDHQIVSIVITDKTVMSRSIDALLCIGCQHRPTFLSPRTRIKQIIIHAGCEHTDTIAGTCSAGRKCQVDVILMLQNSRALIDPKGHTFPIIIGCCQHDHYSTRLSYLSVNKYESDLLFKVLSDRSERSSTIVTTNLPFSKWTELFENTTMVSALVDRLTYRSHVLDMNGPSYRLMSTREEAAAK